VNVLGVGVNMWIIRQSLLALTVLVANLPAAAHHSFAMFDTSRTATVHGTVRAFQWENPHVWLWIVSNDRSSDGVTFAFETASINELSRFHGWNKHILNVGDKVTVDYTPLRSGKNGGHVDRIVFPNGRVLLDMLPKAPPKATTSTQSAHHP
jgi:Family of unknown function (DUF6152)